MVRIRKVTLKTTAEDLNSLSSAVDKIRGKWVEVDKQTILNLIMDHSVMYGRLIDIGENVNERERTIKKEKL